MIRMVILSLVIAVAGQGENLLVNDSMEAWHPSGLVPRAWGVWTPGPLRHTWRVQRDDEIAHDGQRSMRIEVGDWVNVFSGSKVEPGETYTYSAYVRCDRQAEVGLRFSVWGEGVATKESEQKREQATFAIEPGKWTRVSVADTIPAGAERVTAYLFLRGEGVYHIDSAMLNAGALVAYEAGQTYDAIKPWGREGRPGETAFEPGLWDEAGGLLDDPEVAYAFDGDMLSDYRLRDPSVRVGASFERPATVRGLALLLNEDEKLDELGMVVEAKRDGAWSELAHERKKIGPVVMLTFEPTAVEAVRMRFATEAATLRIYSIEFVQ